MFPYRRDFFKKLALWLSGAALPRPASTGGYVPPAAQPGSSPSGGPPAEEVIRAAYDLVVVGGGIAGTCAAISAARNGMKVALVHERSMLGGNSSSEVKLFPENNSGHQPWIREGGIHDEFHTEERTRNHQEYREGTMNAHWDLVLYEWAIREPKLTLYLNTHMHRVLMERPNRIRAVYAIQLGTEKSFELAAPLFVDATGDGVLGFRAGAQFRWGREARSEYGEAEAPEVADEKVMGNTLFFRAVNTGRPVPFRLGCRVSHRSRPDRSGPLLHRRRLLVDRGRRTLPPDQRQQRDPPRSSAPVARRLGPHQEQGRPRRGELRPGVCRLLAL